jgi:peptide/nickel transport system substrate-binding protein
MSACKALTRYGSRIGRRALLGSAGAAIGGVWLTRLLGAPPATGAPAGSGGTLLVGEGFDIANLDPGRTLDLTSNMINLAVYDTLVTFAGEDLKTPKPHLATSWAVSPDGKTYTFRLRSGVKFESGRDLTSEDVKWSFNRLKNIESQAAFLLDGVDSVGAPDPQTVTIKLQRPKPSIIPIVSHPSLGVLDRVVVQAQGGDAGPDAKTRDHAEGFLSSHSAGTGAFRLVSYSPNNEVILARNPSSWRQPHVDRVVLKNILEPASQQLQIERGSIDVADAIGHPQADALVSRPGVVVRHSMSATTFYLLMNLDPKIGGPFSNPKVQQAVRYALDYQGLMALAGPGAVRLAGMLTPAFPGALPASEAIETDRGRAKALLKEANVTDVRGKLSYVSGWIRFGVQIDPVVQKIQADLATVGIHVELNGMPILAIKQLFRGGNAQFLVYSWAPDYADQDDYLVFLPGRLVGNYAHWTPESSPEARRLAALGAQAETEIDPQKRVALYQEVDRGLAQGPWVPLFVPAMPFAYRSNIHGATYNAIWELDLAAISKG